MRKTIIVTLLAAAIGGAAACTPVRVLWLPDDEEAQQ